MKNYKIIFTLILILGVHLNFAYSQRKSSKKNIEEFIVSPFARTITHTDSVEIAVFIKIPNFALQYVKQDTQFKAQYEAVIALQSKKGKQISREVWQDSIVVKDYQSTNSFNKYRMLKTAFNVPHGKYKIVASLSDLDTRNSSEKEIKIDLSKYKKKQFLHTPILLDKSNINWGFKEGFVPATNNATFEINNGLTIYLSGKVQPEKKYRIHAKFKNIDKKTVLRKAISDETGSGIFEHLIFFPKDSIEGMGMHIDVELVQGKFRSEKSAKITLRKQGISHLVSDFDEALHQMIYILEPNEKKELKKVSSKKKEKLFRKFWKRRDPTPDTNVNEMMNEYYRRVAYANVHFDSFLKGWETDMGMIYIIYGPPDDIERYMLRQRQEPYERWSYYRIHESFTFRGDSFGHYKLTTPYLGYRR